MSDSPSLNLKTDIRPISDFRSNAAATLEHLKVSGRPMVLTQRGRSAAVLLGVDAYQAMVEELQTLRDIAQARADLAAGKSYSTQEARERLQERWQ